MVFSRQGLVRTLIALAAVGALVIVLALPLVPALLLSENRSGRVLCLFPMAGVGKAFELRYRHSANRGAVVERYHVDPEGAVVLDSALFESFGAGVPSAPEAGQLVHLETGGFVIENIGMRLGEFSFFVGVVAGHVVTVGERSVTLTDLVPPQTSVRVSFRRVDLFTLVLGGPMHG